MIGDQTHHRTLQKDRKSNAFIALNTSGFEPVDDTWYIFYTNYVAVFQCSDGAYLFKLGVPKWSPSWEAKRVWMVLNEPCHRAGSKLEGIFWYAAKNSNEVTDSHIGERPMNWPL